MARISFLISLLTLIVISFTGCPGEDDKTEATNDCSVALPSSQGETVELLSEAQQAGAEIEGEVITSTTTISTEPANVDLILCSEVIQIEDSTIGTDVATQLLRSGFIQKVYIEEKID